MKSLQYSSSRRISDSEDSPSASTTEVSGWSFTSNSVTTPKLPPPPRKAQNKSGFSLELARTIGTVGSHESESLDVVA